MLVGLSSCTKNAPKLSAPAAEECKQTTELLLALLERGDRYSTRIAKPADKQVLTVDEISKYVPNDSIGELFYQVYAGKADKAIRKAKNKKGTLVTVGDGITGLNCIELAGGKKAYEGDYISKHSVDSLLNLALKEKKSIMVNNTADSVYQKMKCHEKDAIVSYLYNVNETILTKNEKGKSFFEYLSEGNKGMVQSKFNITPSSKAAAAGLAKRNLVQMIVFGDGEIYNNKAAQKNFKEQLQIIKKHKKSDNLLKEIVDIVESYGVDSVKFAKTKQQILPSKKV